MHGLRRSIAVTLVAFVGCSDTDHGDSTPEDPDASADAAVGGAANGGSGTGAVHSGSGGAIPSGGTSSGGVPSAGGAPSSTTGGAAGNPASGGASPADAGGDGGDGGDGGSPPDATPSCALTASGPVTAHVDGEVIELLDIESTSGPAIVVEGFTGVTIRNVRIRHAGGAGIEFTNADDLVIENVHIVHTGAPASGPNDSDERNDIVGFGSARVHVTSARLERGSSGIYLVESPSSVLRFIEGHDFRGPFPRGQLVQWDKSNDGVLEDFSVVNPASAWTEDNVNVYQSTGVQIRRGLVDGNNSPSGVGVIFDGGPSTGLVEDVDAVHMGNGCFSNYDGADGNVFRRTRCRDNVCTDQGRGTPSSNALMWCGKPGLTALRIEDSTYFAACNPGNIVWPDETFAIAQVTESDFTPRAPLTLSFCWE